MVTSSLDASASLNPSLPDSILTEAPFVLELHQPKNLVHVNLIISLLSNQFQVHGYDLVDDPEAELLNSSRKAWLNFLIKSMTYWTIKAEELNDTNVFETVEMLSKMITLFSGRAASGERVVTFKFLDEVCLKIREPSFSESDLGWQTWPAGILLASLIVQNKPWCGKGVLELGSGTGIVGLVSSKVNPEIPHILTDYHENVLTNLTKNSNLNSTNFCDMKKLNWDWFEQQDPLNWELCSELADWEHLKNKVDTILAADILYQLKHAISVPKVIKAMLKPTNFNNASLPLTELVKLEIPKAYILIPIRSTHLEDTTTFEREIHTMGLNILFSQAYHPPNSIKSEDISQCISEPLFDPSLTSILAKDEGVPIIAYKLYILANPLLL